VAQASFEEVQEIGRRVNQYHLLLSDLGKLSVGGQDASTAEVEAEDW
jgi:hypothetical protein